jgi:hypothetical protein
MTTAAQVKKLVQPLLARHDDLVLSGNWLLLKPAHHVLRGILIDRTGRANRFRPRWAAMPLCEPEDFFILNWGAELYHPGTGLWDWGDPERQSVLTAIIEREALPAMRPLVTLDAFFDYFDKPGTWWTPFGAHKLRRIPVEVARGNLALAMTLCEPFMVRQSESGDAFHDEPITGKLCPLLFADDRPGLVRLLKQWQAYTVKQLKLENVWEPTPFPLERML